MAEDKGISSEEMQMFMQGVSQPSQPETESQGLSEEEFNNFMNMMRDPVTGKARMPWSNGSDSMKAIQKSPLSFGDRTALAVGNDRGRLNYLKKRYEDARLDKDGFKVKKDGLWYAADPEGRGEGSAWDKTKELVTDITADIIPELTHTAAGALAGLITIGKASTGVGIPASIAGAGLLQATAQAGSSAVMSSLGRYYGTYQAEPLEQMLDITKEAALAGVMGHVFKPGAKNIGQEISKSMKKSIKDPNWIQRWRGNRAAELNGITDDGLNIIKQRGNQVADKVANLDKAGIGSGTLKSGKDLVNYALDRQADLLNKRILPNVRKAVNTAWKTGKKEAMDAADNSFVLDFKSATKSMYNKAQELGLGRVTQSGKFKLFEKSNLIKNLETKIARSPDLQERELLSSFLKSVQDAKNGQFAYSHIKTMLNSSGKMNGLMRGKKAVEASFEDLASLTSFSNTAKESGDIGLGKIINNLHAARRNTLEGQLKLTEAGQKIMTTRSNYHDLNNKANLLLEVAGKFDKKRGSSAASQALLNKLSADRSSSRQFVRAFDEGIDALSKYDKGLRDAYNGIQEWNVARSIHPVSSKYQILNSPTAYAAGAGGAEVVSKITGAEGGSKIMAALGITSLINSTTQRVFSPRVVLDTFGNLSPRVIQSANNSGLQSLQYMRAAVQGGQSNIAGQMANSWIDSIGMQQEMENQLNQQIQQQTGQ
jgi:hypothetical protein